VGYSFVVEYRLLRNFRVRLERTDGHGSLMASGSIMESAKTFRSLTVSFERNTIFVSVHSCLTFWKRRGSPDFTVALECRLDPGAYDIRYRGPGDAVTPVETVVVK
jgi:hypothetical protein